MIHNIESLVMLAIARAGSISALARYMCVSRQAVQAWASGKSIPSGRHVVALIKYVERQAA